MAGEIRLQAATGLTVKALIVNEAGIVWNGTGLVAVSTLSNANWTASLVACTEQSTSAATGTGLYLANWPGTLTQLAVYSVVFFSGASPAPGDLHIGSQDNPTEYSALDDAIAELGVGVPSATPSVRTALMLMYMALRGKLVTQTSGTDALEFYNNAGVLIWKKLLSDDGADYTEDKATSG